MTTLIPQQSSWSTATSQRLQFSFYCSHPIVGKQVPIGRNVSSLPNKHVHPTASLVTPFAAAKAAPSVRGG